MERRKTCPECGSDNMYSDIGSERPNATYGNHLLINKGLITKGAALDIYVCGECGYVRTFISEQSALDQIKKTWDKVD